VVTPEHVHLLVSEPRRKLLSDAIHYLKLSFAKGLGAGVFWQKRYYDRNLRSEREFKEKLRYIHRNPVKRGRWPRFAPRFWALTWVIRHCIQQTRHRHMGHPTVDPLPSKMF
jgi:hypothetical protein